jgi:hypothetical protein
LLVSDPDTFHAVEIKSGETIASDFFANLDYWRAKLSCQTITPGSSTAASHTSSARKPPSCLGMIFPRSSPLSRNDEGCKPWESTRKTNLRSEGTPHSRVSPNAF